MEGMKKEEAYWLFTDHLRLLGIVVVGVGEMCLHWLLDGGLRHRCCCYLPGLRYSRVIPQVVEVNIVIN